MRSLFRHAAVLVSVLLIPGCGASPQETTMKTSPPEAGNPGKTMHIRPRYARLYTDPGIELAEENYLHKELDWNVPVNEAALVCIDCWNWHFSRDTLERIEECTRKNIVPLLAACRRLGMLVIHAPADPVASRHPNWVRLMPKDAKPQAEWPDSPGWPPEEFKQKTGPYAQYKKPSELQEAERASFRDRKRDFDSRVRPVNDEPVILNGEELHRLCAKRKILHLFFIGFNTNACVMMRDYGLPAMKRRGYHCILVRDCTAGMEIAETVKDLTCTKGTIATIEQFLGYTVTSKQLQAALDNGAL